MSGVPAEARKPNPFAPVLQARNLASYSMKILKNNRFFRSRPTGDEKEDGLNPSQPELVAAMRTITLDIYLCAFSANETPFTKVNYRHRRQLQDKAISKCNELLALAELSMPVFHMSARRLGYWGGWIVYTRNLIQKWKESDYKRYRRM